MHETHALFSLAHAMGVHTGYTDGLGRSVNVPPDTLVQVCRSLGAPIEKAGDAIAALRWIEDSRARDLLPPVLVAWDGKLPAVPVPKAGPIRAELALEDGGRTSLEAAAGEIATPDPIPPGYHRLDLELGAETVSTHVISAPTQAWRRPGSHRSWGVGTHLAALRSTRSRSVGDLRDLEDLCRCVGSLGGDLVTVLPLLPTFNQDPAEPSPYSPVSRLFWSELILDLGNGHHGVTDPVSKLEVTRADREVRAALSYAGLPPGTLLEPELARYARFRGAQARLGRDWREWPDAARNGRLSPEDVDPGEERFHLVAQLEALRQLRGLRARLGADGFRLGLDLAVGVHPHGFDPWSRQDLFADDMSVGAPPDPGFPSGQDWGFSPVLPEASRREGHRYLAACIAHQARLGGLLRVDHVMAFARLYCIPHGFRLDQGTYVTYPADELFAVLTLESHRHRCEVVGENLGTVPREIDEALPRHRIWGMYLAQFQTADGHVPPPSVNDVALVGTHDTPTFAGWLDGVDIEERVRCGLLAEEAAPDEHAKRVRNVEALARSLEVPVDEREALLMALLSWLGRSGSPLVIPWLEDLWLEREQVNLPGTRSTDRPNWQRPMNRLLDEILRDPGIRGILESLERTRSSD
jgi:4-alpha-glucanotransferase